MSNAATARSSGAFAPRIRPRGLFGSDARSFRAPRPPLDRPVPDYLADRLDQPRLARNAAPGPRRRSLAGPFGAARLGAAVTDPGYWQSWIWSVLRVSARLCSRGARRRSLRPRARGQCDLSRNRVPGVRTAAPHPPARLGAGLDHLLADAGTVDRLRDLPRRLLHHRPQRRGRRQVIDRG